MPTLPLTLPVPLDGGDLPVRSADDVKASFPVEVREEAVAPVRDAIAEALAAIGKTYQLRSRQAVAQSDPLRAEDFYLDGLAADSSVYAQPNEDQEALRARLIGAPAIVTPNAIVTSVNDILAPYTTKTARYFESEVDCWFVGEDSFVFNNGSGASPHYPDRLYPDDSAENSGDVIANREVVGPWVFSDTNGRLFFLRIPPLEAVDDEGSYVVLFADDSDGAMWIADGSDTSLAESDGSVVSFLYTSQSTSDDIYSTIASTVENIKGQGIRWGVLVDSLL